MPSFSATVGGGPGHDRPGPPGRFGFCLGEQAGSWLFEELISRNNSGGRAAC